MLLLDPQQQADDDKKTHTLVEASLVKDECRSYAMTMYPVPIVISIIAYCDAESRACAILLALVALLCIAFTYLPMWSDNDRAAASWHRTCNINMVLRTVGHLVLATWQNESLIWRVFTLILLPLSTSRQCHAMRSFKVYALIHMIIVACRLYNNLQGEWPWLLLAVVSADFHFQIVADRIKQRSLVLELDASRRVSRLVSQSTTKSLLETFCDATVMMEADTLLLESPPQLEALLTRKSVQGRHFTDFVDSTDKAAFQTFLDGLLAYLEEDISVIEANLKANIEHAKSSSMSLSSCSVHLSDPFSVQFEVNVFAACIRGINGKPTIYMGLTEHAVSSRGRTQARDRPRKALKRINFDTGQLESIKPSFVAGDVDITKSDATLALEQREVHRSRRRDDSPIVRGRESEWENS